MSRIKAYAAGALALTFAALTFLLRRRTRELQAAKVEVTECREDAENQKEKDEIASLETEVDHDEKNRLAAKARLDAMLTSRDRARRGH